MNEEEKQRRISDTKKRMLARYPDRDEIEVNLMVETAKRLKAKMIEEGTWEAYLSRKPR